MQHVPVMMRETLLALDIQAGETVLDCTFGRGGHSREFLELVGPNGKVIGLDVDAEAEMAAVEFRHDKKFRFMRCDFRDLDSALAIFDVRSVDKVFFDFGVSSPQLDSPERGFSFQHHAKLDMRMDKRRPLDAREIVNAYSAEQLASILWEFGEERWNRRIAAFIVEERAKRPIETTMDLVRIIKAAIPEGVRSKEEQHPARRTFQALRIAVNDELGAIHAALPKAVQHLARGGRICCISFHSLEDRAVKHFFIEKAKACLCPPHLPKCVCQNEPTLKILSRKVITASAEEAASNPRSRSARLRVAERL